MTDTSSFPHTDTTLDARGLTFMVAGGGTSGHIEPALAVADALVELGGKVVALGTPRGLEVDVVPARGHHLETITPVPVPRKPTPAMFALPGKINQSIKETRDILRQHNVDAVIGFGGYVAAPAYLAAKLEKIPFFVHEANARAGLANKLGVKLGGVGLITHDTCGIDGEKVGIPVRKELAQLVDGETSARLREEAYDIFGAARGRRTVLVTGGSQGAVQLNKAVAGAAQDIVDAGYQILHAYGKKNEPASTITGVISQPFITDMAHAYALADLIVCRAGAMTVAEVAASRTPAVFVPLPHGNGEQALNATGVVDAGAALIVDNDNMTPEMLRTQVLRLLGDDATRAVMAQNYSHEVGENPAHTIAQRLIAAARNKK